MLAILYLPMINQITSLKDDDIISIRDEKIPGEIPQARVFRFIGDQLQLEIGTLRKQEVPFWFKESDHNWEGSKIASLLGMKNKTLVPIPTSNPTNHDYRVVSN